MKGSIHVKLIGQAALVAALAIPAVARHRALGNLGEPQYGPITDTLGGNGRPAASSSEPYQHAWGPDDARLAADQGYRFITDTLGGNGGPGAVIATTRAGFSWSD